MINSKEFTSRLREILAYYNLSSSSFAEKINVQPSSISHLLSGRNKPSLDFVLKVVHVFKEVELYWLLNGKGNFPSTPSNHALDYSKDKKQEYIKELKMEDDIERIVIFYTNGSFKEYKNKKKTV